MNISTEKRNSSVSSKTKFIQSLFLFLIFPITQVLNFFSIAQELNFLYSLPASLYYCFLIVLLFMLILAIYSLQKYFSKKSAEKKYKELSNLQAYQKDHYKHIQAQREHLDLLKTDFHKQIELIADQLNNHREEQALSHLNTLTEQINSTKEYPYCPSQVINAVLSGKERECRLFSIAFQIDLQIGHCDTIPPAYLCSIFANLLDNAINACQKIADSSKRYIHLTAKQVGDYIHIKVINSSTSPVAPKEGHGYGQKILKDIAAKYNGQFQTHYEKQTYETYLSIQLPE